MRNLIPNEQKLLNYFGISGNLVEPKTFVLFCSICLSEMEKHRNLSLDSREYRNVVI